jgi:AraC-like DNA-binding protein
MRVGHDLHVSFAGIHLVHENLPGKSLPKAHAPEHVIYIPLRGEIQVGLDGKDLFCAPGRLVHLPPFTEHSFASSLKTGERLVCRIPSSMWQELGSDRLDVCAMPVDGLVREILFHMLHNPETELSSKLAEVFLKVIAQATVRVKHAEENVASVLENRAKDDRIKRAISWMELHCSSKISMNDVAKNSGLSVRNMNRLFSTELSVTPLEVLTKIRMAKAYSLLSREKIGLSSVAQAVGYEGVPQFLRKFREIYGYSPKAIRLHAAHMMR